MAKGRTKNILDKARRLQMWWLLVIKICLLGRMGRKKDKVVKIVGLCIPIDHR